MPPRAIARTRNGKSRYNGDSEAAIRLRKARETISRQRKKFAESKNAAQYSQLAFTMVGGGLGGAAQAYLPNGVMGVDARLAGGVVLAGGCLLLGPRTGAMAAPLCGLAAGMLASWLGDHAETILAPDEIPPADPLETP